MWVNINMTWPWVWLSNKGSFFIIIFNKESGEGTVGKSCPGFCQWKGRIGCTEGFLRENRARDGNEKIQKVDFLAECVPGICSTICNWIHDNLLDCWVKTRRHHIIFSCDEQLQEVTQFVRSSRFFLLVSMEFYLVSMVCQESINNVSSFKGVLRKFHGCFKKVSGKFQGSFKKVSRVFK